MTEQTLTIPSPILLQEPASWRDLLATLISDPKTLAYAVEKTDITAVTLKRWAGKMKVTTTPRSYMLKPLLIAFPEYAELFTRLIVKDFPDFAPSDKPEFMLNDESTVTLELYEHVLAARATTPLAHLFWSASNHVLRPALDTLDPTRSGIGIWVYQCLSNEQESVYCLRARIQFGTIPWRNDPYPALLLGRESLAGYAVSKGQSAVCQDINKNTTFLPIRQEEHQKSVAAFPILFGERIAGCLLVASTQMHYFTPTRVALIERYSHLLSLAFRDHEFFESCNICLQEMPPTSVQQQYFVSFRERVDQVIRSFEEQEQSKSITDAEQIVWGQIAHELSSLSNNS